MLLLIIIFMTGLTLAVMALGLFDGNKEEKAMEGFCKIECR